jgi:hypothetical protein
MEARMKSELLKDFLGVAASIMKGSIGEPSQRMSWTRNDEETGTMDGICFEMNVGGSGRK